jgi:hypothetical protein
MRTIANRAGLIATLVGALTLGGCGGAESPAPLMGSWTYSGQVPAFVTVDLTFNPDQTFTFVEKVAPPTTPAGSTGNGCVTTHTFSAAYAETVAGGVTG